MGKFDSNIRDRVFKISLDERPDFKGDVSAFVYDSVGNLLSQAPIKDGQVAFDLPKEQLERARLFIAPTTEAIMESPTILSMKRLNAYEAQVAFGGAIIDEIGVPGAVIDIWPQCDCLVRGKVVRSIDNRGVCGAHVHICEVEKIERWISQLAPQELYRLRDDLLVIIHNPPPPDPSDLGPVIYSSHYSSGVSPVPEPPAKPRLSSRVMATLPTTGPTLPLPPSKPFPLFRFKAKASKVGQRATLSDGMLSAKALGPQPIPPGVGGQLLSKPASWSKLETELSYTTSERELKEVLTDNSKLVGMLLCQLQERIWRLRCDEVAVIITDNQGHFEARLSYPCVEDRPDYYFWVEYEFEAGFETVYEPLMACTTQWDYLCGSEVILPVTDRRIPGCTAYPDLPGCEVVVLTIGNNVAIQQIQTGDAVEGLITGDSIYGAGAPFGGTLEPRVDFSRTALRDKGIKFYRWSYRRLSGPDGESTITADGSEPVSNDWKPVTRDVVRHYRDKDEDDKTIYSSYLLGPLPTAGEDRTAPKGNLFEIHPAYHPYYPEAPSHDDAHWIVLNQHVDLADAYFDTASLKGSPEHGPTVEGPAPDDEAAGRYELKLELFNEGGELVNWTDNHIELSIINAAAPFGTDDYKPIAAPEYNWYKKTGKGMEGLWGFRTVFRVDNNHCYAEVLPVGGDVEPDPECGFHPYGALSDEARLMFVARHPNHFAKFDFKVYRGASEETPITSTNGTTGELPDTSSAYSQVGDFLYESRDITVQDLLGSTCTNAAFGEHLDVWPMTQNGYDTLDYLHDEDTAAFALAEPCDREDDVQ